MNDDCVFPNAPQCRAKSKRTLQRCKGPAVKGWAVCRFHGARGGAPKGPANGSYRHGNFTNEALVLHKSIRELLKECQI